MRLAVQVSTLEESNLFLRALWSRMRARFGRLGWQYTPHRYGTQQIIRIGFASLGTDQPVTVSVHYRKRGVIDAILFTEGKYACDAPTDLGRVLRASVDEAQKAFKSPTQFPIQARLTTQPRFAIGAYKSSRCIFAPLSDETTHLTLRVDAFDQTDAEYQFHLRASVLLDLLATWTNCAFQLGVLDLALPGTMDDEENKFLDDNDWIEHQPVIGNFLRFSAEQLAFADQIVAGYIDEDSKIARASHLFHEALRVFHTAGHRYAELISALLISALEVVSVAKPGDRQSCKSCGQPIHRISRRVIDLGARIFGSELANFFRDQYDRRSAYLHRGQTMGSQPLTSHLHPQLDPNAPEGCAMPRGVAYPNVLVEFTSFILRREICAASAP